MPPYVDVHRLPDGTDADALTVAQAADLRVQDKYDTHYLNYWAGLSRSRVFCLVEAPEAESAVAVHREAHGLVAEENYQVTAGEAP